MMLISLALDLMKGDGRFSTLDDPVVLRQNDGEAYVIDASIRANGQVFDLTGMDVRFYALKPDGTTVVDGDNTSVVNPARGEVMYTVPQQLTASPGDIPTSYFRVTATGAGSVVSASTQNIAIRVIPSVSAEIASGDYVPEIDRMLALLETQRASYETYQDEREERWQDFQGELNDALTNANNKTMDANRAAEEAREAAAAAREAAGQAAGAISRDLQIYMEYETVGDTDYLTLVDTEG